MKRVVLESWVDGRPGHVEADEFAPLPRMVWLSEILRAHKTGEKEINEPFIIWGSETQADGSEVIAIQCTRCRAMLGYRARQGFEKQLEPHCRRSTASSLASTAVDRPIRKAG